MNECFGIFLKVRELVRPMSRRQRMERRELPLPSPRTDWHFGSHQKCVIFDSSLTESCRFAAPGSCGIEEAARYWAHKGVRNAAVPQTGQTTDPPLAELVHANRLFARLVWQQVRRPRNRSEADGGEQRYSSCELQAGGGSVPAPDIRSQFTLRSGRLVTIAQAAWLDPAPASIETLCIELARRRLHSLALQERPR
jgi:hypothetical protein